MKKNILFCAQTQRSVKVKLYFLLGIFLFSSQFVQLQIDSSSLQPQKDNTENYYHSWLTDFPLSGVSAETKIKISDLSTLENYSSSGNGTQFNPFILQNLNISGEGKYTCLEISSLDVHIVIQSPRISLGDPAAGTYGIYLKDAGNITIDDAIITGHYHGIYIYNCENILIQNSHIYNNYYNGIKSYKNDHITIISCRIAGSTYQIYSQISHFTTIQANVLSHGDKGIYCSETDNDTIVNNEIFNVEQEAIYLFNIQDFHAIGNIIDFSSHEEMEAGFKLYMCVNGTTSHNRLIHSYFKFETGSPEPKHFNSHEMENNTIDDDPIGVFINQTGLINHDLSEYVQVLLFGCQDSKFINFHRTNLPYPVYILASVNVTCENFTLSHVDYGIIATLCNSCIFTGMEFMECDETGFYFKENNFNVIKLSTILFSKKAVDLQSNMHTVIQNSTFSHNYYGFYLSDVENTTIMGIEMNNVSFGISTTSFDDLKLIDNFINGTYYDLDFFDGGWSLYMSGNELHGSGLYFNPALGSTVIQGYTIYQNNTLHGNPIYFYDSVSSLQSSDFETPGQILLVNCDAVEIGDITLQQVAMGIFAKVCDQVAIDNVSITNSRKGIVSATNTNINITNSAIMDCDENGIYLYADNSPSTKENVRMADCNISNCNIGIDVSYTANVTISGCQILECYDTGIYIHCSSYLFLQNNTISMETDPESDVLGIEFVRSEEVWMRDNHLYHGGLTFENYGGNPSTLVYYLSHSIDTSNFVNDKILYYYRNAQNLEPLDFVNAGQILLFNCSSCQINSTTLSDVTVGFFISDCENVDINHVEISQCSADAIYIQDSEEIHLYNVSIHDVADAGIYIQGIGFSEHSLGIDIIKTNISMVGGTGIYVSYCDGFVINDSNVIEAGSSGLYLNYCDDPIIHRNNFRANDIGIRYYSGSGGDIRNNSFYYNIESGLYLKGTDLIVDQNEFWGSGLYYDESNLNLGIFQSWNVTSTNSLNGKQLYYLVDKISDTNLTITDPGQLFLINCSNFDLDDLTLSDSNLGIMCFECTNISISEVFFSNQSSYGCGVFNCHNVSITTSQFNENAKGLILKLSTFLIVSNSIFNSNDEFDLYGYRGEDYLISGNNFTLNGQKGIFLYDTTRVDCWNNYLDGTGLGVHISGYSTLNVSFWNNIFAYSAEPDGNLVIDESLISTWDKDEQGNYWSDYQELYPGATAMAGIWDTPYLIPNTYIHVDNYPLEQNPYAPAEPEDPADDDTTDDDTTDDDTTDDDTTDDDGPMNGPRPLVIGGIVGGGVLIIGITVLIILKSKKKV